MKYSEKVNRKIDKLIAEKEAAKKSLNTKKEKAEADLKEGQLELTAAAEANDDSAYHAAKNKIRFAEDTIEMCSNKLAALDTALCSESDFTDTVKEILMDSEKAEAAADKKIAPLVNEIYSIACELDNKIDENDQVMQRWCSLVGSGKQPVRYDKRASEVLYLLNMIDKRRTARVQAFGIKTNIYDSLPVR